MVLSTSTANHRNNIAQQLVNWPADGANYHLSTLELLASPSVIIVKSGSNRTKVVLLILRIWCLLIPRPSDRLQTTDVDLNGKELETNMQLANPLPWSSPPFFNPCAPLANQQRSKRGNSSNSNASSWHP